MNIYRYDSSKKLSHLEDYGVVNTLPSEVFDCGNLYINQNEELQNEEVLFIVDEQVLCSCSLFKISGKSKVIVEESNYKNYSDLNSDDIVYCGIILTWIGFGTLFELDNGCERIVSPYLTGGSVR